MSGYHLSRPARPASQRPPVLCASTHAQLACALLGRCRGVRARIGGATPPGAGARPLLDLARDVARVGGRWIQPAISYAAYRLLVWRASFGTNLGRAFGQLIGELRALCLSPDFSRRGELAGCGRQPDRRRGYRGRWPRRLARGAALRRPELHARRMRRSTCASPGSTVHDATFWQPLALARSRRGPVRAGDVQTFVDAQWGRVTTFASGRLPAAGPPPFGSAVRPRVPQGRPR